MIYIEIISDYFIEKQIRTILKYVFAISNITKKKEKNQINLVHLCAATSCSAHVLWHILMELHTSVSLYAIIYIQIYVHAYMFFSV